MYGGFYREYDSKVELISKEGVKKRFPCMNVDDIVLASVGIENEGWYYKYFHRKPSIETHQLATQRL